MPLKSACSAVVSLLIVTLIIVTPIVVAQPVMAAFDRLWPGTEHAADVPTMNELLGHAPGERISSPEQIRQYFEALAEARPAHVRLLPYATSWQGRELFYAVIGRPDRIADLDAIQADIQTIARPDRHDRQSVEQALARVPATAWLSYAVHGNEISPADAAMVTAWHLLAAEDDALVESILDHTLVFIAPLQNPDGRARFIHGFESALGLEADPDRLAAEHDEPWPSGRVNHYLFDLNRDWLALTQPEIRGQVDALLDWYPLVFVDAHEMGPDSSFFFAPEAVPYNPLLDQTQRASLALFGENNARWFDRHGYAYFTREIFDAFYPGYGASWPSYYGGIAMTYEQGSTRGLVMRTSDGREISYAETVEEYVAASLATLETTARERQQLWQNFARYRASGSELARADGPAGWVIPAQRDQGGADRLGQLLADHGLDVYRTSQALERCGQNLEAGSYLIPAAQPDYRKLRVLLDEQVDMAADFLAEQERRRARGLGDQIYDVTAWSLPLMFNVELLSCRRAPSIDGQTLLTRNQRAPEGRLINPAAKVGFLTDSGSTASLRLLAAALRDGLIVERAGEAFRLGGREYPAGSLIFQRAANDDDLADRLAVLARSTGATVIGTDTSWVTEGPSFGSPRVTRLHAPRIALAWDRPTDVYSPGAVRFVFERQYGYPVSVIRTTTLARADLSRYDVLILPDESGWRGRYADALDPAAVDRLKRWVDDGGVLVTLAGASAWAADPDVDLLAARLENAVSDSDEENDSDQDESASARVSGRALETLDDLEGLLRPDSSAPDSVAGVLLRAEVDQEHWLGAGTADTVQVLVRGNRVFSPLSRDQGHNLVRYAGPDVLLASGHLWEDNRRQLAYKPFVMIQPHGRGQVIAFAEDPAVRAYLDGLNSLLIHAVLVAPSHTRVMR